MFRANPALSVSGEGETRLAIVKIVDCFIPDCFGLRERVALPEQVVLLAQVALPERVALREQVACWTEAPKCSAWMAERWYPPSFGRFHGLEDPRSLRDQWRKSA